MSPPLVRFDRLLGGGPIPDTGYPRAPRMIRGGLVRLDPLTRAVVNVVVFQYNPDTLTRTLQPRAMAGEPGDRLEVLRLTGAPRETIKLEAEFDAADALEHPKEKPNEAIATHGLAPALAMLEGLVSPSVQALRDADALFDQGALEIAPAEAPLTVLVWGVRRVVPVLVTSLSITEEAFDPQLRPIRAKASLELRILTSNDLPLDHLGGSLYLTHRQTLEQLAGAVTGTDVRPLGLEHLP
jgi:hypothetical protein